MIETLGLEMEMPVAGRDDGVSRPVAGFFRSLAGRKAGRGMDVAVKPLGGRDIAVAAPGIYSSVDNAYNNLESSIGPVAAPRCGLARLADVAHDELSDVLACLEEEALVVLNAAEHPEAPADDAFYARVCAPKPIYRYWVGHRGWTHIAGVDAKAHNSPSTGVDAHSAVDCLNVMLGLAPAFIALFANSPLENGRRTGVKENRLTLFPRMFATSRFAGDQSLGTLPARPFADLADHFRWMFGPHTAMQAIPIVGGGDYKTEEELGVVDGDPALLTFLAGDARTARSIATGRTAVVIPTLAHLEYLQYANFLDARIRWTFASMPPVEAFFEACERPGGVEALFAEHARGIYIEGRAAGANFPDRELGDEAGDDVAASVIAAPSAIQLGLLRNLPEALDVVERWGWQNLRRMREAAIAHALAASVDGQPIRDLCADVLAAAERGLDAQDRRFLAYPAHVLASGRTGADRLLESWAAAPAAADARLREIAARRGAIVPPTGFRSPEPEKRDVSLDLLAGVAAAQ